MEEYRAAQQALAQQLLEAQRESSSTSSPPLASALPVSRGSPPPLPPRKPSQPAQSFQLAETPAAESKLPSSPLLTPKRGRAPTITEQCSARDPRSSSMQSLPPESHNGRRTLLLIYIHGFMGNETSFQAFPAHVHNFLRETLQESHVVHTKIYPRYKSRNKIEVARDGFSRWLKPHQSPQTDIVLLGHSMGGLLAAEVALMPASNATNPSQFKHCILGTVSFDTPFLGMHPGLIGSGIASLFRPAPPPPERQPVQPYIQSNSSNQSQVTVSQNSMQSTERLGLASPATPVSDNLSLTPSISSVGSIVGNDPNYNAPFPNDIHIAERTGINKFLHFVNKHSDGLTTATKQYFVSHLEFGGCLADFPGLKKRYAKLRELEDMDDCTEEALIEGRTRIRFINYYTASTGIPKTAKIRNVSVRGEDGQMVPLATTISQLSINDHERERTSEDNLTSMPRISIEEHREGGVIPKPIEVLDGKSENLASPLALAETKEQIAHLGAASGVQPRDAGEDELAPMQVIDQMPIMSDEENYSSGSEFHGANDEPASKAVLIQAELQASTQMPAPPAPLPPTQIPNNEGGEAKESLEASVTPTIIRTPPSEPAFPPLPEVPAEPAAFDSSLYQDKDARKIAEKDHARMMKAYKSALKDHAAAVKDREKMRIKREKQARDAAQKQRRAEEKIKLSEEKAAAKEAENLKRAEEKAKQAEEKEAEKERLAEKAQAKMLQKKSAFTQAEQEAERLNKERERMEAEAAKMRSESPAPSTGFSLDASSPSGSPSPALTPSISHQTPSSVTSSKLRKDRSSEDSQSTKAETPQKPKKDRRFCLLPNDLTRSKEMDKCWVRVYMEGVDEVGAHCGLFFQGQQYESLVGDVGERIAQWVKEDATRRCVKGMHAVD